MAPYGEHPNSMAMVTVHRTFQGEDRLCFGRVRSPESMSLSEIQKRLDYFKNSPVEIAFPCQLRLSRRSRWLRAAYWWLRRNCSGRRYGDRIGTFGMSSLAGQGTLNRGHPSIHTTSITYGPLDEAGSSLVTLQCDHRVMDGMAASRCLMRLQYVMLGQVQQELEELGAREEERQAAPCNRAMPELIRKH